LTAASGRGNYLIPASILIAGLLIAVSLFLALPSGTIRTTTITIAGQTTTSISTETSISTLTSVSTSTVTGSQPTGPSPVTLSASFDVWNLTAHLDRTVVPTGQQLNFTFYVENTYAQNESIAVSFPLANPAIYTQSGKLVWSYEQFGTTAIQLIAPGEKLYEQLSIPTSGLQAGQTYIFTSSPNIASGASPIGQYLQVYTTITILPSSAPITSTATTSSASSTSYVTGTTFTNASDTYLTTCVVMGIGGLELRVVSDSTNASVSGELVNAVDTLGCDIVGQPPETQIVHLDNFSVGQEGWLIPIFPNQAEPGGQLSFTVVYQGSTYQFTASVPPIGAACVTLHVPSGNVTHITIMNGNC